MQTAIRLKQKISSDTITISIPEIARLHGREVEIILLVEGEIDDASIPPRAIQNSHVAGSIILDEEAMQEILNSRFR